MGNTKVICAATVEERVPVFLRGTGEGWLKAEYSLLPSATSTRTPRESTRGKQSGRTQEIQRLIGRSLRSVMDLKALGERTIIIDCDVIQADGGTRTASITGAFIALVEACETIYDGKKPFPVKDFGSHKCRYFSRGSSFAGCLLRGGFHWRSGYECSKNRRGQLCRDTGHW